MSSARCTLGYPSACACACACASAAAAAAAAAAASPVKDLCWRAKANNSLSQQITYYTQGL